MTDLPSMLEYMAQGARWVLIAAFLLSAAEKVSTIATRSSSWHPMMLRSAWRRAHAGLLMSIAFVADACAVLMLAVLPPAGALLSAVLVGLYTVLAMRSRNAPGTQSCQCFLRFLNTTTRRGDLFRNACLLLIAALVFSANPPFSASAAALAAILLTALHFTVRRIDREVFESSSTPAAGHDQPPPNYRVLELG